MADSDLSHEQTIEPEVGEEHDSGEGEDEAAEGAPDWMVTYGDMMSLLLCFFILLVSFSTMDVIKFRNLVGSLRDAFGAVPAATYRPVPGQISSISLGEGLMGAESLTDEDLEHDLTSAVEQEGVTGEASLQSTDQGIVLTLRGQLLFDSGSATLRKEALPLLDRVAAVCRRFPRRVRIEGHTDNIPPTGDGPFPTNWDLSAARAAAVVGYLLDVEHIAPERFVACGYAATDPIASNLTAKGRAENRRVQFVFTREGGPQY